MLISNTGRAPDIRRVSHFASDSYTEMLALHTDFSIYYLARMGSRPSAFFTAGIPKLYCILPLGTIFSSTGLYARKYSPPRHFNRLRIAHIAACDEAACAQQRMRAWLHSMQYFNVVIFSRLFRHTLGIKCMHRQMNDGQACFHAQLSRLIWVSADDSTLSSRMTCHIFLPPSPFLVKCYLY